MKKKVVITCITTILLLSAFMVGVVKSSDPTTYPDVFLSGGYQAGHFDDVWDLYAGDIVISFTYDANGLVDDYGGNAHAWAELGVRSLDTGSDFNPWSTLRTVGWTYSCVVTLYADQDIPVGSVTCTGDEETLVVEYDIDDPWLMFEAHLHVATSIDGIPQSKGNPIPGKFNINVPYDPAVDSDSFSIDLSTIPDYTPGATLYIAAHAKVMRTYESMRATISALTDIGSGFPGFDVTSGFSTTDTMANLGTGTLSLLSGLGQLTGYYGTEMATLTHRGTRGLGVVYGETDEVDRQNINNPEKIEITLASDVYVDWLEVRSLFIKTDEPPYNVPEEAEVLFYKDGVLVHTERLVAVEPIGSGNKGILRVEYATPYKADLLVFRVPEPFTGRNEFAVAALEVYQLCEQWETAWGEGTQFNGKNWATYMTCTPEPVQVAGSGVWLATDYDWTANTFDPDPPGAPTIDLDDKLILQKAGGHGEGDYNLPSPPPNPWANHRVWWDRDGVDPWQNPETANTEGIYQIIISLHATSLTTGTAYMNIRGLDQGFETDGNWNTIELTPAGMTFTGDMKHLQVFYGLYGFGVMHSISFTDITVTQG